MPALRTIAISAGLAGSGVMAFALSAPRLVENPQLDIPLNALGINRSPYGEVFAMAMQSPVDRFFHEGMGEEHHHSEGETCDSCEHDHGGDSKDFPTADTTPSLTTRFNDFLLSLAAVEEIRTNPKGAGERLKLHLRRQTENKLRFAHQLDPSHYGNYNSLHFFLSEPGIGTSSGHALSALKLADETIQYCLNIHNDPRPALTAAAAATNVIHLMFIDHKTPSPRFTPAQMRQYLNLTNLCLERYRRISHQWEKTGNWALLSAPRVAECQERFAFVSKVRDAAEITISRFESAQSSTEMTNRFPAQSN